MFKKMFKKTTEEVIEEVIEEEWIWVDGYKGFKKDLTCRDFQYEIGKKFVYDGEVELYSQGFHFCIDLRDVFDFYNLINTDSPNTNRFCKVKALVKKKDYDNYDNYDIYRYRIYAPTLVAKEIEIISELTDENLIEFSNVKSHTIENIENDYKTIRELGLINFYKEIYENEFKENFSELYSTMLIERLLKKSRQENRSFYHTYGKDEFLRIRAIIAENPSKDMMIYFIENILN